MPVFVYGFFLVDDDANQPIILDIQGEWDPQYQMNARQNFNEHLVSVDSSSGSKPSGGHNYNNLTDWVTGRGGTYQTVQTSTRGIYEVYISVPNPQNPGSYINSFKTVYDPNVHSDNYMISSARQAGSRVHQAVSNGSLQTSNGNLTAQLEVDGILFEVRINTDTVTGKPLVGSVYPVKAN